MTRWIYDLKWAFIHLILVLHRQYRWCFVIDSLMVFFFFFLSFVSTHFLTTDLLIYPDWCFVFYIHISNINYQVAYSFHLAPSSSMNLLLSYSGPKSNSLRRGPGGYKKILHHLSSISGSMYSFFWLLLSLSMFPLMCSWVTNR